MKWKIVRRMLAASLLACGSAGALASAPPPSYTGLTIFGDSLTDTGNVFVATSGGVPPAPLYWEGRFSDGPVWVDYLAESLGVSATAFLQGGQNYAFGGARTGWDRADLGAGTVPGLLTQSVGIWGASLGTSGADSSQLYVLVGGGNDMRDARSAFRTDSAADQAGRQTAAEVAASNLVANLGFLASVGVTDVLIGNLPDLGRTPEAVALNLVAASTDATERYNALMPSVVAAGQYLGLHVSFVDLAATANAIYEDAILNGGALFGITNVFTPCGGFPGSVGISCDVSAYSDGLHPTTVAHKLLGEAAYAALAPIPEPETYALLAFGLLFVGWRVRRRGA